MTPKEMQAHTAEMLKVMKEIKRKAAFVGLPAEKVGEKIYGDGRSVIATGATHEYGYGPIPQRSFLRAPFDIKRKELDEGIAKQFEAVTNGSASVDTGLGRVGVLATNVSKGAFTSRGYGTWPDITDETKQRKGSDQVLIDTGILRGSITWVIRDAS